MVNPAGVDADFYRLHSPLTDPSDKEYILAGILPDVVILSSIVRNATLHRDEALWRFGIALSEKRKKESEMRRASDLLEMMGGLHPRAPFARVAVTCRDFSLLLCAMLRQTGVPSRLRVGFAGYFPRCGAPNFFDDHWIVEYWDEDLGWRLVDAQISSPSDKMAYQVEFDPTDVPRDKFVVAGQAWVECRHRERDPNTCTISGFEMAGMDAIKGALLRDLAALNKVEALPWDFWGMGLHPFADLAETDLILLDHVAAVTMSGSLTEIAEIYRTNAVLRPGEDVATGMASASPVRPVL